MTITSEQGPADESGLTLRNREDLGHQADDVNDVDVRIVKRELAARQKPNTQTEFCEFTPNSQRSNRMARCNNSEQIREFFTEL
jgi:hypothetical protein